ncbi:MAG: divalent-cation tolerance protein CutA [Minwuia sp.]|uniref:divalent-cation tolerance protein CutA n=1 Tax=Minwuia sp. TaxID=2493630 RepID=UPI003A8739FC
MNGGILDIWINCPDRETAGAIAEGLIARRLAACANILGPIESVYYWKGAVEREGEVPLVVKTRESLFDAAAAEIARLHPYETPSIIGLPVARVNCDYRDWVIAETEAAETGS